MKFEKELKQSNNPSIKKIGEYLAERAKTDPSVAKNLEKEQKTLNKCYAYIKNEARKQAVSGCACIDDETVYGWAVHYYDEDDIDVKCDDKKVEDKPAVHKLSVQKEEEPKHIVRSNKKVKKQDIVEGQISLF